MIDLTPDTKLRRSKKHLQLILSLVQTAAIIYLLVR